jgi:hypothetical protein
MLENGLPIVILVVKPLTPTSESVYCVEIDLDADIRRLLDDILEPTSAINHISRILYITRYYRSSVNLNKSSCITIEK